MFLRKADHWNIRCAGDLPGYERLQWFRHHDPMMFDWSREQDSLNNFVVAPGQSYSVYSNKLNWISASRPAANIQQKYHQDSAGFAV